MAHGSGANLETQVCPSLPWASWGMAREWMSIPMTVLLYHHLPFKLMIDREPWGHHFLISPSLGCLIGPEFPRALGAQPIRGPRPHPTLSWVCFCI